jgi:site-specific recombinase XerD
MNKIRNLTKFCLFMVAAAIFFSAVSASAIETARKVFPHEMNAVKDAFGRAVKKAKLEDLHFHDLRHTFATRLVQAGIDLYAVKQMMGHRSIKTTERYAHHAPESLRPSVRVLDECYNRLGHNLVTVQGKATDEKVALP